MNLYDVQQQLDELRAENARLTEQLYDAQRVAARRAGADLAVRDLLLYEFGTTDADLIRGAIRHHRESRDRYRAALLHIFSEAQLEAV